jgi:hypothetical protein
MRMAETCTIGMNPVRTTRTLSLFPHAHPPHRLSQRINLLLLLLLETLRRRCTSTGCRRQLISIWTVGVIYINRVRGDDGM